MQFSPSFLFCDIAIAENIRKNNGGFLVNFGEPPPPSPNGGTYLTFSVSMINIYTQLLGNVLLFFYFLKMSQNKTEIKIIWGGVHDISKRVEIENNGVKWKTSFGNIFTNGFTSCRKIVVQKDEFTVLCKIYATLLNRPIFECTVSSKNNDDNKHTNTFRAFTSTTSMKNVFKHLGISPRRNWNGNEFFGLYRDNVKEMLKKGFF